MIRLLNTVFSIVIVGSLLAVSASTQASATDNAIEWRFKVFLDNKSIGTHDYRVVREGSVRTVETTASFDVKFLFINAYSYRHDTVEQWNEQCLTDIDAYTDANGKETTINGSSKSDGFVVDDGEQTMQLSQCVMSFAYWNPNILQASKLLNAQTGDYESISVSQAQPDSVTVNGDDVAANRHDIVVKDKTISVWYAAEDKRWLALEAPAKGKRVLRYEPLLVPQAEQFANSLHMPSGADAD